MKVKAVLFDLDGTLLPMDQDKFIKAYLGGLVKVLAPHGYNPDLIAEALWASTRQMFTNDGSRRNEEVFWDNFCAKLGESVRDEDERLVEYYNTDFQKVKETCGFIPEASMIIRMLHEASIPVILATNPLFPSVATESRIRWAGLDPSDFMLVTTYENSRFCKPNVDYYKEILEKTGLHPEDCIMIGNDVTEDMVAQKLGMRTFLVTDSIINKENKDISIYRHGTFAELVNFIKEIINE